MGAVSINTSSAARTEKSIAGLRKLSAGAVDETVDAAMRGPDRVEQRVDRIRVPDVGWVRGRLQVAARQMRDDGVELAFVAADNSDMRAEACKQPRNGAPDAAGASRHHNDQILERVRREDRRMDRKLIVGQAGLGRRSRRLMIIH